MVEGYRDLIGTIEEEYSNMNSILIPKKRTLRKYMPLEKSINREYQILQDSELIISSRNERCNYNEDLIREDLSLIRSYRSDYSRKNRTIISHRYSDLEEILERNREMEEAIEIQGLNLGEYSSNIFSIPKRLDKLAQHDNEYFRQQARRMTGEVSEGFAATLEAFKEGGSVSEFSEFFRGYLKKGREISDEELAKYELVFDMQRNRGTRYGGRFESKYFDTEFNLCLAYEGKLIASVGFDAKERELFIGQIQGIRGNGDSLRDFKWQKALIDYAVRFAEEHAVPRVVIQSVENNRWAKMTFEALKPFYPDGTTFEDAIRLKPEVDFGFMDIGRKNRSNVHLSPRQGSLLYNGTAKKCKFKKREDGNYERVLIADEEVVLAA